MTAKAMLRPLLRARRAAHVAALAETGRLAEMLDRLADRAAGYLPPDGVVAGYVAVRDEVDPLPLLRRAAAHGRRLALPHVTGCSAPLRFLAWDGYAALHPGPFGLLQPADDAPEIVPALIVTPLLGFDAALTRLGQGAGHYDRAFAALPAARRVGLAWSVQQIEHVPVDPWDVPLHAVVTEEGTCHAR